MKFNIEIPYQLPYEKEVCIDWLTKHNDHGLQDPSEEDLAWVKTFNDGVEPELEDLVKFRLSPSVWYNHLQNYKNFSLLTCIDWLNNHYDNTVLYHWDKWLLNEIDTLLEERNTLSNKSVVWLDKLKTYHLDGGAQTIGVPIAYHHGTFTRTIQFNIAHPSIERIPSNYKPTMLVSHSDIEDMDAFCVRGLTENIT